VADLKIKLMGKIKEERKMEVSRAAGALSCVGLALRKREMR
jgi:hypothetical protein